MKLPRLLDVMTLNVWGLPWPFAQRRAERFAKIERHLSGDRFHLVGLQEVWLGAKLKLPTLRLPGGRGSGLALAGSLAPHAEPEVHPFDHASGSDRLAAKGLLVGRIGALTVAVTHLQAHAGAGAVRRRQVGQLLERLRPVAGPLLLMGDFNFHGAEDDASEAALADAGLRDAATGREAPTFWPRNPFTTLANAERFDRIYLRDGADHRWSVRGHRVLPRLWSDHQPVHAELALDPG